MVSQVVDPQRVSEILKYIEGKELFVIELLDAINKSIANNNPDIIEDCLNEWEASAELNSISGFPSNVQRRYKLLVKAGLINAE